MNSFDEIFAKDEEKVFGEDITGVVDIMCDQCHISGDQVFYDKVTKKVKLICEDHESFLDIDLSWLVT